MNKPTDFGFHDSDIRCSRPPSRLIHFDQITDLPAASLTLLDKFSHRYIAYEDGQSKVKEGWPPYKKEEQRTIKAS